MFKLDDNFLNELGLSALPPVEKNKMLAHIYETLEMRVGMRLAEKMTNEQLDEFEAYINKNDEAGALTWLETNFPNYKQVVAEELEKLKSEISQVAPQIVQQALDNAQNTQQNPQPQMPDQAGQGMQAPTAQPQSQPMQPQPMAAPQQPAFAPQQQTTPQPAPQPLDPQTPSYAQQPTGPAPSYPQVDNPYLQQPMSQPQQPMNSGQPQFQPVPQPQPVQQPPMNPDPQAQSPTPQSQPAAQYPQPPMPHPQTRYQPYSPQEPPTQ